MPTIRYGIASRTATYWNLYLAQQEGLYAAEGLAVEPIVSGDTAATIAALVEGRVDLAGCSPDELVTARQRGADLVIVGGVINRPVSSIVCQAGIDDLGQLRGRRIGVSQTRGGVSMVLRAALRDAGLAPDDYQQVAIGTTPAMVSALRDGQVDAAMLTAPFDHTLAQEGFSAPLNVGTLFPSYAFTTVNARRVWALDHQPELAAFFRATRAAGDRIANSTWREAALRALATGTGLQGAALAHTYEVYREPGVLSRHGEVDPEGVAAVLRLMAAEGLLADQPPRIEDLLQVQLPPA